MHSLALLAALLNNELSYIKKDKALKDFLVLQDDQAASVTPSGVVVPNL